AVGDPIRARLLVVAMSMEELPVGGRVRTAAAARGAVVVLQQIAQLGEVPSTPGAPPALPLEQGGLAGRQLGVAPESAGPIAPVAVVRAGVPSDHHVAPDRGAGMGCQ